ncbi:MAG: NAD(P)H-dependent glycerol-3-phosphate dehydrogenase [Rhodospirillales bacterium]|nr:NAD(P)H-dependent glycerol-3-phosphate dehydrogenase [Rhodospirillales bacterium]
MNEIAVIGAGAWGTALAIQAHRAGRSVTLWARDPARAAAIAASRANPHLPGIAVPAAIDVTATMPAAGLLLLAVPAQHLRGVAAGLPRDGAVLVCAKGVEIGSLRLPLETLAAVWPARPAGVLTGPNFAGEIARGLPAAAVIAGTDAPLRAAAIAALGSPAFRLYGNDDPVGAQVGGAAKNVVAIAAGAVIGAGLGENARAALVTRGLAEIARLATALGGRAATVSGLSGLGDLLLTCTGAGSRNFSLGVALGRGERLADILAGRGGVTEGVASAAALVARAASAGVVLPICTMVSRLVGGEISLAEAINGLLSRPTRDE